MGSWSKWSFFALLIAAVVTVEVGGQDANFQCYKHTSQDKNYTPLTTEKQSCTTCCTLKKDDTEENKWVRGCAEKLADCGEKKEVEDAVGDDDCKTDFCNGPKVFKCYKHEQQPFAHKPDLTKLDDCNTCCFITKEGDDKVKRGCAPKDDKQEETCKAVTASPNEAAVGKTGCQKNYCNGPEVFQCYKHDESKANTYTPVKTEKEPCNTCCTLTEHETEKTKWARGCAKPEVNCNEKKELKDVVGETNCKGNYCNGPKFFKCYKHASQAKEQPPKDIEGECNTCCTIEEDDDGKKLKRDCAADAKASCGDGNKKGVEGYKNACTEDYCNGPNIFQCYVHGPKDNAEVPKEIDDDCNTCCTIKEDNEKKLSRGCSPNFAGCHNSRDESFNNFGLTRCAKNLCNGPRVFQCYFHRSQNKTQAPAETQNCTTCCIIQKEGTSNLKRSCAEHKSQCSIIAEVENFGTTGCNVTRCNGPQSVTAETTTAATPGTNQTGEANETDTKTTTTGAKATTTVTVATTTAKAEAGTTKKPTTKPPPKQAGGDGLRPLVTAILFPTLAFFLR